MGLGARAIGIVMLWGAVACAQAATPTQTPTVTPTLDTCGPSPWVVTNTNTDTNAGSLQWALLCKVLNVSGDVTFNIPGAGPHTIMPISLPGAGLIGGKIDGTTQLGTDCGDLWGGTAPTLEVIIDGSSVTGPGMAAPSSGLLQGLRIINFHTVSGGYALQVTGTQTVVRCNSIEDNENGINEDGNNVFIGGFNEGDGNVIVGSAVIGLNSGPSINAVYQGNFIGVDPDGVTAHGNGTYGINIQSNSTQAFVGGNGTSRKKNLISSNASSGIHVASGASDTTISSNYIGVNATNTGNLCNGNPQIFDEDTSILSGNVLGACVTPSATPTPTFTLTSTPTVTPTIDTTGCLILAGAACAPLGHGNTTCGDYAVFGGHVPVDSSGCASLNVSAPGCCLGVVLGVAGCTPLGDGFGACNTPVPTVTPTPTPGGLVCGTPPPTIPVGYQYPRERLEFPLLVNGVPVTDTDAYGIDFGPPFVCTPTCETVQGQQKLRLRCTVP